ncbi:MAG TPA: anthrone oxygenase family protein [Hymenobacter sp.]|jgi:uncharacterized membrane protein
MEKLRVAALALVLLVSGLSAGQMYNEEIGGQPALAVLSNRTYVEYWQALDKLMAVRMPTVGMGSLAVFVFALLVLYRWRKTWPYWLVVAAFLCTVADAVVTVTQQVPVNQQIQALQPDHLPADVAKYKVATAEHFHIRAGLRIGAFLCVILAALSISQRRSDAVLPVPHPNT